MEHTVFPVLFDYRDGHLVDFKIHGDLWHGSPAVHGSGFDGDLFVYEVIRDHTFTTRYIVTGSWSDPETVVGRYRYDLGGGRWITKHFAARHL